MDNPNEKKTDLDSAAETEKAAKSDKGTPSDVNVKSASSNSDPEFESAAGSKKPLWKRPGFYGALIAAAVVCWFLLELVTLGLVPMKIVAVIIVGLLVLLALAGFLLMKEPLAVGWRVLGWILAICLTAGSCSGAWYMQIGNQALAKISSLGSSSGDKNSGDIKEGESIVHIYALKDSLVKSLEDLQGRTVGTLSTMNEKATQDTLKELTDKDIHVETKSFASGLKMAQELKGQAIDAMVLDQGYLDTLSEMPNMDNIEEQIVALSSVSYTVPKTNTAKTVDTSLEPFTVYISGIDTRENKLLHSSRTDVNLLVTVNPKTHEILLISIPRDYYVETVCEPEMGCMNGAMDKLTHTGLHGPETTEMTLEKLFDIDINYNVRVNFSSLVNVVDELGGVTVHNPSDFTTDGYHFTPGDIELSGPEALAFVRERYSFTEGDRERGRNQMRVLTGIIQKMLSPALLTNFSGIMETLSSSFETNMSDKEIKALVAAQISNPAKWSIYSYSTTGTGGTDFAAELGDNAYVMYPDQFTVDNVKADIQTVLAGEVPPYTNDQATNAG